jgi:hypothetical protein
VTPSSDENPINLNRKIIMKRIFSTAAFMLLASATAAYAAAPDAVTKAIEACCALGAACCNGGPCC